MGSYRAGAAGTAECSSTSIDIETSLTESGAAEFKDAHEAQNRRVVSAAIRSMGLLLLGSSVPSTDGLQSRAPRVVGARAGTVETVPFSREEFFGVFASYNAAVWPAQLLLYLLAGAIIVLVVGGNRRSRRAAALGLALLWTWVGIAYHCAHFTAINPAAWAFGAIFVVQGGLLLAHGIHDRPEEAEEHRGWRGWIGGGLLLYALIVYPLLGLAVRPALEVPILGVPCPTTIYTVGIFFLWAGPPPRRLLVIPLLWAFFGSSAVVLLGVVQDVGLFIAGLSGLMLLRRTSCTGIALHS